jgi:hypothetical protein
MGNMRFDGETYNHERDFDRLNGQLHRVFDLIKDGAWRTIPEITDAIGDASPQSISARLRDLRKDKFGAHTVERRYLGEGLYEYRLVA